MGHPTWPLFDLEVHTSRLTMRYIDDDLAVRVLALARQGIHDPATMPFTVPWTDVAPPQFEWQAMQYYWRCRADTGAEQWDLPLAVLVDDEVAGVSGLGAKRFATLRQFETGSWLGRDFQGRGLGKELRIASLTLGFDGFGARYATTSAFADNAASLGVTRSLGYGYDGTEQVLRRQEAGEILRYRMSRSHFDTIRRDDIELVGVGEALPLLGLNGDG